MPAPRKYPAEVRERAVRLVFESGRPIAHVAVVARRAYREADEAAGAIRELKRAERR